MVESMTTPQIRLDNLSKRFGDTLAVDSVTIDVPQGAFLVLLGPSGCGKTTLLRMLAGLETPSDGAIWFGDELVASPQHSTPPGSRNIGLVFQSYALWPHMTVRQNIEWPLKITGADATRRRSRCDEVLDMLGIASLAERYPSEISGGQQQRVAVARTLGPQPKVLLFDEPLSNLDAKLRVEMRAELLRVHRLTGATSVYVTHDQIEAITMATHVAVLNHGRTEQVGTPYELLEQPSSPFVARFLGTPPANLLPATAQAGYYVFEDVALHTAALDRPSPVLLMYKPTSLTLTTAPNGKRTLKASIVEVAPLAGRYVATCLTNSGHRLNIVSDTYPDPVATSHIAFPAEPDLIFTDPA